MHVIESSEVAPSAELETKIHQSHRGLTSVLLRRRGRQAFKSIQLEGKDGSSVGHREPPSDKPHEIAAKVWSELTEHAARYGAGAYEVELVFASGEKGPPPKAVIIPLALGDEYNELGNGTDPAVVVELAMRMCGFTMASLRGVLEELPRMAAATTANMVELRKLGESMLEAIRNASSASDAIEVAKLEAKRDSERLAFAREFMAPGMQLLKDAIGGGGSSKTLRDAAAVKSTGTASAPLDERVAKLQAECIETGKHFARSLTESQLTQLAHIIGAPLVERVRKLRDVESHSDVLTLVADIVDLGAERAMGALKLMTNEQGEDLDKLQELSKQLTAKPGDAKALPEAST